MAEKNGLFVFKATEDSASIINTYDFVPKTWVNTDMNHSFCQI